MKKDALEDLLKDIGKKLYRIRHDRYEKIETVAKGVGVSHSVVSKIENGRYGSLSLKLLSKITDYYGCSVLEVIFS